MTTPSIIITIIPVELVRVLMAHVILPQQQVLETIQVLFQLLARAVIIYFFLLIRKLWDLDAKFLVEALKQRLM